MKGEALSKNHKRDLLIAGGSHTAYTYETPVTLGSDGMLSIYFQATLDQATVAGIEIMLPAVLRIDAGSTTTFSDELAPSPRVWQADDFFTGKRQCTLTNVECCAKLCQLAFWKQTGVAALQGLVCLMKEAAMQDKLCKLLPERVAAEYTAPEND